MNKILLFLFLIIILTEGHGNLRLLSLDHSLLRGMQITFSWLKFNNVNLGTARYYKLLLIYVIIFKLIKAAYIRN